MKFNNSKSAYSQNSNQANILITGMGSTTAISVVKGLRQQQEVSTKIIGVDINHKNEIAGSKFCDVFYQIPLAVNDNYILRLIDICEAENISIIFPIVDIELEIIATHINEFISRKIKVWVSSIETIKICNNKYQTYKFFLNHQIPTPFTWLPEEIKGKEENLTYPLIVKPQNGFGSADIFCAKNPIELNFTLKKITQPIVQEYLEGKEFTIDVVADEQSNILAVVPRERIEVKAGICYKGKTIKNEQIISQTKKIAELLSIKGHCNIQCRLHNEIPIFFEINPRFSGTLPLTIAAGVNSPLILVKLAKEQPLKQNFFNFQEGVYMARYWEEYFY